MSSICRDSALDERAAGNDRDLAGDDLFALLADDGDERLRLDRRGHELGEPLAVDAEGGAGRHAGLVCDLQQPAPQPLELRP